MTIAEYAKPLPVLEGLTKEFYGWCARHQLRFQRCAVCRTWRHVPRELCAECGAGGWEWAMSSGKGTVFTWTVAARPMHPAFDAPLATVVIEMAEGVRVVSEVVDCPPDELEIGMPVTVTYDAVTPELTLPKFRRQPVESKRADAPIARSEPAVARSEPAIARSEPAVERSEPRVAVSQPRSSSLKLPPTILYDKQDRSATVTINRPDAMNALTGDMLAALDEAFEELNKDPDVWVAILTGAGDKAFCAGMDLKEAIPRITSGDELGYDDHTKRQFSDVFKPIICAVNGYCIAGGMEMLEGTDIRIASEQATFSLGEVRWGIIPTGGSHIRLPRQVPWAVAMELLLTGRRIDARRAYEVGLVNEVVPQNVLMPAALKLAEAICKGGPLAVQTAKEIAVRALLQEPGFVLEKALGARVFSSEDAKEGPRAFDEKRPPRFTGR